MSLSKKEVQHIAKLARLHIDEEQLSEYQEQLSSILDYVAKLQELDTDDVAELQHAADALNVFREDQVKSSDSETRRRILENFSNRQGDLLEVQAVFENRIW